MARTVPKGEDRGPRDKLVAVYFSEEEALKLERLRKRFGFRSKGAMITWLLEVPLKSGFSGFSFATVGRRFADLIEKSGVEGYDLEGLRSLLPFGPRDKPVDPSEFYTEGEESREHKME